MPRAERIVHSYRCPALPSANGGEDGRPYGPCSCGAIFRVQNPPWLARPFRVLVADPPWQPDDQLPGTTRGAANQYPTLSTVQLCAARLFPIPLMMDDAVLALWRLSSMQQDALDVVSAWGFTVKTELVWVKLTVNGKKHFGMGRQVRAAHETCLIATRGRIRPKSRSVRSVFEAPVPTDSSGRRIHSAKPDAFFDIIERLYDGPYVELFSRRERSGWLALGNEICAAWQGGATRGKALPGAARRGDPNQGA